MGRKSREKRERRADQSYWLEDDRRHAVASVRALIDTIDSEAPRVRPILQELCNKYRTEHTAKSLDPCWVPAELIDGALALTEKNVPAYLPERWRSHPGAYASDLHVLLTWLATQTVLYFDPDLVEAITQPDVAVLPPQALLQMPVWCPYITFPPATAPDLGGWAEMTGFFAQLDWDTHGDNEPIIRVALPNMPDIVSYGRLLHERYVYLDRPTIRQGAVDATATSFAGLPHTKAESLHLGPQGMDSPAWKEIIGSNENSHRHETLMRARIREAEWACALLLYACTTNADIADPHTGPVPPAQVRAKASPHLWDVGWRIGAQLRSPRRHSGRSASASPSGRLATRPHVRRAHWHHYWTGPRTGSPEDRSLVLKWLPPTLVAADGAPIIPTVRGAGQALDEAA